MLSAHEEQRLHLRMLRGAAGLGHRSVVFKPHPSAPPGWSRALERDAERLGVAFRTLDTPVLAEVACQRHRHLHAAQQSRGVLRVRDRARPARAVRETRLPARRGRLREPVARDMGQRPGLLPVPRLQVRPRAHGDEGAHRGTGLRRGGRGALPHAARRTRQGPPAVWTAPTRPTSGRGTTRPER
nr:hypothetical protein [Streptomyces hygroscopicus]